MENKTWVKAFKGFNEDLTCTPNGITFQYEQGKTYKEDDCRLCESGFHACEAPLDVFKYYPPAKSVYHQVELNGVSSERHSNTKICGNEIRIGAKISIAHIAKMQFEYVRKNCTNENNAEKGKPATAGYSGVATAGYSGAATAGCSGAATAGDSGAATAGYSGAATSRGSVTVGKNGVGTVRGNKVKIRGGIGALLVAAEEHQDNHNIATWATAIVDGEEIKSNTWYCVKDGKFVEVE